jgi:hypothetical protein
MNRTQAVQKRRAEIIKELADLDQLRRGSVIDQVYESVREDGTKVRRGPYPLYSFKEKGKTVSRRIKDPKRKRVYEGQIQAFRRFQALTAELLRLGEELADLALAEDPTGKKTASRPTSKSKRTPK